MLGKKTRRAVAVSALAAVSALTSTPTATAAPVSAPLIGEAESVVPQNSISTRDAHGDIPAPGVLTINYIHVYGQGTHVAKVDVGQRSSNLHPAQESVCGGTAEIAYYQNGQRKTETLKIPGCTLPSLMLRPGHYVTFPINKNVDNNSSFCGRSETGKGWSPYACVTIHS